MAHQSLWNGYMEIPVVTRAYTTACVVTTLAVVSYWTIKKKIEEANKMLG